MFYIKSTDSKTHKNSKETYDMNIIFLADGWGNIKGGINAFNYSLVKSMGETYGKANNIICVSYNIPQYEINNMKKLNINLISLNCKEDFENPKFIIERLNDDIEGFYKTQKIWIGHDYYTGPLALDCKNQSQKSLCGIIHHMSYMEYYPMVCDIPKIINEKIDVQKNLIKKADIIFANGPRLYESACAMCTQKRETDKIFEILPGLTDVEPNDIYSDVFSCMTFGRIEKDGKSMIKQTNLSVAAWSKFVGTDHSIQSRMSVIGYGNDVNIEEENKKLKTFAEEYSNKALPIVGEQYISNQTELMNKLKSHNLSLMLSREEGFGLVGLEAISAGTPIIITKNSGLYVFLKNNHLDNMVLSVDVNGSNQYPFFSPDDLNSAVNAIKMYYESKASWKRSTLDLRQKLKNMNISWENCAKTIIDRIEEFDYFFNDDINVGVTKQEHHIDRVSRFSDKNNRKWINRKEVYEKLEKEFKFDIHKVLFVHGKNDDENPLTLYYWLRSKEITDENIIYFCANESETSDVFLNYMNEYCKRKNFTNTELVFLLIDGFNKKVEKTLLSAFSQLLNLHKNIRILVFCEEPCDNVSNFKRSNPTTSLTIGALRKEELKDFFKLYQYDISNEEIVHLEQTGYSITVLKKCIIYILDGLDVKQSVLLCMENDYENLISSTKVKALNEDEILLASILYQFDFPFSKKIAYQFQSDYCNNKSSLLNLLQKGIIYSNSKYSYCVEPLFIDYFRKRLPEYLKEKVFHKISKYYYLTYKIGLASPKSVSHSIMCGIYACKYLQKSKSFDLVDKVLSSQPSIVKSAKNAGLYSALSALLSEQIKNTDSENYYWNIYNYLHCLSIIGEYKKANNLLSNISLEDIENYDCKIGILRLQGETKLNFQKRNVVLDYILNEYNKYKNNIVLNATNNQIEMFIVRLLIDEDRCTEATEICNRVIKESVSVIDKKQRICKYNIAVAHTYLIKIKQLEGQTVSKEEFAQIKNSFKQLSDIRGFSWVLGIEGEMLLSSNIFMAHKYIKESVVNRRNMCEKSAEYISWIKKIRPLIVDAPELQELITNEEKRLSL